MTAWGDHITEKEFQATVVELAKTCGWTVFHDFDSRRNEAGFPDLVLVRPPKLLFRELKRKGGQVTAAQRQWLLDLTASGADAGLWRPADWEEIERTLTGVAA